MVANFSDIQCTIGTNFDTKWIANINCYAIPFISVIFRFAGAGDCRNFAAEECGAERKSKNVKCSNTFEH